MTCKFFKPFCFLVVAFLCGLSSPVYAQTTDDVVRIEISGSFYHAEYNHESFSLEIIQRNKRFYFCPYGEDEDDEESCSVLIPSYAIEDLIEAASMPPLEALDVKRMGINEEELNRRAEEAFESKSNGLKSQLWIGKKCGPSICSGPAYKNSFLRNFVDLKTISWLFKKYFVVRNVSTPSNIGVSFYKSDGKRWSLSSGSQTPLMLPWTVFFEGTWEGKWHETYAPEIAQALYIILSNHTMLNEMRLATPGNYQVLNYFVRDYLVFDPHNFWLENLLVFAVQRDMDFLKLRNFLGEKIQYIESQYDIQEFRFNGMMTETGTFIKKGIDPTIKLNFHINHLEQNKDALYTLAQRTTAAIEKLQSISWFMDWLKKGKEPIEWVEIDKFYSNKKTRAQNILNLLEFKGFNTFAQKWLHRSDELIFFTVVHAAYDNTFIKNYSKWVLLPDGEMILWDTNLDQVYLWGRYTHGDISNGNRSRKRHQISPSNRIARIDTNGNLTIIRADPTFSKSYK